MNPSREELLFHLTLTKPVAERAAWLDRGLVRRNKAATVAAAAVLLALVSGLASPPMLSCASARRFAP